jgi:hypothetical protein
MLSNISFTTQACKIIILYLLIASPGPSPVGSHTLLGSLPLLAAATPLLAAAAAPVSAADESSTALSAVAPTSPPANQRLSTVNGKRFQLTVSD